jgi:hypothetical protein
MVSDLVDLHEVRWDRNSTEPADSYVFFYRKGNVDHHLETGFIICTGITSVVKTADFVSDSILYFILRGSWHDIIILNVHGPPKDRYDNTRTAF